jgi:hypothetical protein
MRNRLRDSRRGQRKNRGAQHAHFRAVRCDCFGLGTDLFGFEGSSIRGPRSRLNEHCNITKTKLSLHAGAGINLLDLNPLSKKPPRGLSFGVIPPQLLASSGQAFPSRTGSMFELPGRRPLSSKDLNLLLAWGRTFGYAFAFWASPGLECSMALAAALLFCPWKREMRGFPS